ncbi:MAG: rod shape-determining protein MreD [Actinomycetota bacterium]|nr:rod shape-determining protein MreD [Actinomycetota bacterium]
MIVTWRSALRVALLVLLFVILQNTFFSQVQVLGASIWILPACAAIFGLLGGSLVGATVGFSIGFLADALGDGPLGTACLLFMAIGYLTGVYRERGDIADRFTMIGICGLATIVANLTLGLYTVVVGFDASVSASFIPDLVLQGLYGVLLAFPIHALIHRVLRPALIHESPAPRRAGLAGFDVET